MIYFIGMDDTDNTESRSTGHLARQIAGFCQRILKSQACAPPAFV
jgi:hypothetical protein